jgi:hypothetical protein
MPVLAHAPLGPPERQAPGRLDGQIVGSLAQVQEIRRAPLAVASPFAMVRHAILPSDVRQQQCLQEITCGRTPPANEKTGTWHNWEL